MQQQKRKFDRRTKALCNACLCEYLEDRVLLAGNPQATGVYIDSSSWQPSFLSYLGAQSVGDSKLGYKIPAGTAASLPWVNADTLSVQFNQNVTLSPAQVSLNGSPDAGFSTPSLSSATFSYNPTTFTATWVFSKALPDNKYLLTIPAASVTNGQGLALANAYEYSFNVLPGDVDQNGATNVLDTVKTRNLQFTSAAAGGSYSIFDDVDGSGAINVLDTVKVRNLQFTALPKDAPTLPSVAPSFLAGSNESVAENATPQYIAGWATNIESGVTSQVQQSLSFAVSNSSTSLFSAQPSIDSNGDLSFQPAANASGTATVTVSLTDSSSATGNNTSASHTFTITVNSVNQTLKTALADYDLVRNTVQFQPYYGEMKGPTATGETKAGNAWDQAAYLQQKLIADGIQAEVVSGQIAFDGALASEWLETTAPDGSTTTNSVQAALNILQQTTLLDTDLINSQNPSASQFIIYHAWVQVNIAGIGAINLDPSWKLDGLQPGLPGILAKVPYSFINYASSNDPSKVLAYEYYEKQVSSYLATNYPGDTLANIPHTGPIIATTTQSPPTYPYKAFADSPSPTFSEPEIHRVSISLSSSGVAEINAQYFDMPTISLSNIDITYVKATASTVTPEITLDGGVVATGAPLKTGTAITITIDVMNPGFVDSTDNFTRSVGQDAALALDAQQVSETYLATLQNTIIKSEQAYAISSSATDTTAVEESILKYTGMRYWYEDDSQTNILDGLTAAIGVYRVVGVGLVTNYLSSSDPVLDNKASAAVSDLLYLNIPHNILVDMPGSGFDPVALDGSPISASTNLPRFELVTTNASSLENEIIEEVTNAGSISTVKGFYAATQTSGNYLETIDPATASPVEIAADLTQYSSAYQNQINLELSEGHTVTLPDKPITVGTFKTGLVYYSEYLDGQTDYNFGYIIESGATPIHGGAEDEPPEPLPEDETVEGAPDISAEQKAGDPIGLSSGNVTRTDIDISLPDFGQPLDFSRQYDSYLSDPSLTSTFTADKGLGVGWISNYGDTLTIGKASIVWNTIDGHAYTFNLVKGVYQIVTPSPLSGTLTYSSSTKTYTYTDKNGSSRQFKVLVGSALAQLVAVGDRNNNVLAVAHDAKTGRIVSVTDAQNPNYGLTFSYDTTGHLSQVADSTGRVWTYSYRLLSDGRYYLTQVSDPSDASTPGLVTTYSYFDATTDPSKLFLGLLKSVTRTDSTNGQANGTQTTAFSYYPDRHGFQVTDPDGNSTEVTYELFRHTAQFIDANDNVTTTIYDPNTGLTTEQINPDQTSESYSWSPVHELITSYTNTLGDTTNYSYDYGTSDNAVGGVGNLLQTSETASDTSTTTYTYEPESQFYQVASKTVTSGSTSESTTYAYDSFGNPTTITDSNGDVTTLTDGSRGQVLSRISPDGNNKISYTYDPVSGEILTTADSGLLVSGKPATTTNTYDSHYALASITDPTGVTTSYTNDLLGRRISQSLPDPDGSGPLWPLVTTYTYDEFGNLLSKTNPRGLVTQNVYDAKNELVETISPDGTETTNQYDPAGNLIETIDPLGNATLFLFDSLNRQVETINPDSTSSFVFYAANNKPALTVDENGDATQYTYDVAGRLISTTDPDGGVTKNAYDGFGNLTSTAFYPPGSSTAYNGTTSQYDLLNRVVESQGPEGQFQTTSYDANGNVVGQIQYDVSGYNYDATGVASGLTDSSGHAVALSSVPASRQHVTTTTYDALNRPTQVAQPILAGASAALTTKTSYDAAGRVLYTIDQAGIKTSYAYDAAGRQIEVTTPNLTNAASPGLTTSSTLDADGNTISTTDPLGRITTNTYDLKSNRLIATTSGVATAPISTYKTYDSDGNVVATTDALGNRTVDTYDSLNRLLVETLPAPGGTIEYAYYFNSLLYATSDADGRFISYGYDGLGRKTSETWYANYTAYEAGTPVLDQMSWTYNSENQLASETDNNSSVEYAYDPANRLIAQTDANPSQPVVTYSFSYDGYGNVSERDTAVGGPVIQTLTNKYDADNRLIQQTAVTDGNFNTQSTATTQSVNYTLNPDGEVTSMSRYQSAGGSTPVLVDTTTTGYDNDGNVASIVDQQGSKTLDSEQYTRNNDAEITQAVGAIDGTTNYTYDPVGEVATATYSANAAFNENYTFDAAGNSTANVTGGDNRLTSDGTFSYTYDAEGNMISRTRISQAAANDYTTLYTWDNRNRLAEVVTENNQGTVTHDVRYTYDIENRRISETVTVGSAVTTTYFSYANDNNVALTLNASGATRAVLYDPNGLELSEVDGSNTVRWMLGDAQGSVRDVVVLNGSTAQVADHLAYNSFGKVLTETSPATPHLFGYAGQQPDAAVGLNYDQARYYNPQTGRFVSQDPSGLAAGDPNLYRYVFNDPVDFVDPSGLHIELPSVEDTSSDDFDSDSEGLSLSSQSDSEYSDSNEGSVSDSSSSYSVSFSFGLSADSLFTGSNSSQSNDSSNDHEPAQETDVSSINDAASPQPNSTDDANVPSGGDLFRDYLLLAATTISLSQNLLPWIKFDIGVAAGLGTAIEQTYSTNEQFSAMSDSRPLAASQATIENAPSKTDELLEFPGDSLDYQLDLLGDIEGDTVLAKAERSNENVKNSVLDRPLPAEISPWKLSDQFNRAASVGQ